MAEVVKMPKLGFDMAEGKLIRWLVAESETIQKGQVLAEIETDKATVEVEAPASGRVHKHLVAEDTFVPVGRPIAIIAELDESVDIEALIGQTAAEVEAAAAAEAPATKGLPLTYEEAEAEKAPAARVAASPIARRMARDYGLDLHTIPGSGKGGRVVKKDIEAALATTPAAAAPRGPAAFAAPLASERVPLSRLRGAIGRRMTAAKQTVPHFYVTSEVAVDALLSLRAQLNDALPEEEKLSVNDFIVKAAALALREFPNLNSSLEGESIVRHGSIHIGIAVALEQGLMTVVARDADIKPLRTLAAEIRTTVGRAREGKVRPEDVEGSTFTVSNLGMFDVDHFIAIINPSEAAILAIGSAREFPVLRGGIWVPEQRMKVTLSADHRITDGAEAARWLQVFKRVIEAPAMLLL